jgi:hypothetical protein
MFGGLVLAEVLFFVAVAARKGMRDVRHRRPVWSVQSCLLVLVDSFLYDVS